MKRIVSTLLIVFTLQTAMGQMLSPTIVKSNSVNYETLSNLDTILNRYVANNWLVGAVVIVVKDNQVAYNKGFGYSNLASKKPMQNDAIFRIASQTKAITAFAIMQLFEQGKLGLDQNISDFIPEFKNPKVIKTFNKADSSYTSEPANREITFRDLLTHTSGVDYPSIGNDTMQAVYAKNDISAGLGLVNATLLSKIKTLAGLPLIHNPGKKWTYGLSYDILGCLVEVISGESLEKYFRTHILEPLGMKDTYFNVPASKAARLTTVYTEEDNKIIEWSPTFRGVDPKYPLFSKQYFSGGAGLSSTAIDYAIFLQMLLNKGRYNGKQILGKRIVELMLSPQLSEGMFGDDNMTLGFGLTSKRSAEKKVMSEGSFSWGGYYGTTYWADPKEKLVCLIMTQQTPMSHWELTERLMNVVYGGMR